MKRWMHELVWDTLCCHRAQSGVGIPEMVERIAEVAATWKQRPEEYVMRVLRQPAMRWNGEMPLYYYSRDL